MTPKGEAAETQTHLEFALRCHYLDPSAVQRLDSDYEQVLAMLVTMATKPEQWVIV